MAKFLIPCCSSDLTGDSIISVPPPLNVGPHSFCLLMELLKLGPSLAAADFTWESLHRVTDFAFHFSALGPFRILCNCFFFYADRHKFWEMALL